MRTPTKLFLHEEIMLLALRDHKGTIAPGTMYQYALGGAILAELLLTERIAVEETKRKKLVDLVDPTPLGDPLLDECLAKISDAKRRAQLQTWVSRFANIRKLHHRVAIQLCDRGILRADEDKVLLLFTRKIYPELNPVPERKLIDRLHKAIFTETRNIDSRTVVLVSLANSAQLLKMIFDKKKLKQRKQRIEQIVNGDLTGKATKDAIAAMQAAVAVAVIMPMMMTPTMHQ